MIEALRWELHQVRIKLTVQAVGGHFRYRFSIFRAEIRSWNGVDRTIWADVVPDRIWEFWHVDFLVDVFRFRSQWNWRSSLEFNCGFAGWRDFKDAWSGQMGGVRSLEGGWLRNSCFVVNMRWRRRHQWSLNRSIVHSHRNRKPNRHTRFDEHARRWHARHDVRTSGTSKVHHHVTSDRRISVRRPILEEQRFRLILRLLTQSQLQAQQTDDNVDENVWLSKRKWKTNLKWNRLRCRLWDVLIIREPVPNITNKTLCMPWSVYFISRFQIDEFERRFQFLFFLFYIVFLAQNAKAEKKDFGAWKEGRFDWKSISKCSARPSIWQSEIFNWNRF